MCWQDTSISPTYIGPFGGSKCADFCRSHDFDSKNLDFYKSRDLGSKVADVRWSRSRDFGSTRVADFAEHVQFEKKYLNHRDKCVRWKFLVKLNHHTINELDPLFRLRLRGPSSSAVSTDCCWNGVHRPVLVYKNIKDCSPILWL